MIPIDTEQIPDFIFCCKFSELIDDPSVLWIGLLTQHIQLCVAVSGDGNGQKIILAACNDASPQQKWHSSFRNGFNVIEKKGKINFYQKK